MVVDSGIGRTALNRTGKNGTVTLDPGKKLQLIPEFAAKNGWVVESYKSSAKRIATVTASGLVTAKRAGNATVTVATANGYRATLVVKVVDPTLPTKVSLDRKGAVKLRPGDALQLTATLTPDTAVSKLTWKSSNKKVATVSKTGLVRAKKRGTATITVKTRNGKTAKVKIKVVR